MSYLARSGSAAGEGQTVFRSCGDGAGGALSSPFSWQAGLVLPVGVGWDPLEECVACCVTTRTGQEKSPEWLTEDSRQCREGMPGVGRGLRAAERGPG